jgi:nucleoid DNA-binding protein
VDKPISTSVKDYLIKRMAVRMNISPKVIEAVVSHQTDGINKAIQKDNIFSVEMSGFGKWVFNHKKAKKKMEKQLSKKKLFSSFLENPKLTEKQRESYALKLENTNKWIEGLKPKLEKCPQLQNTSNSSLKDCLIQMTS